ncbi:MAG: hypothetical protein JXO72_16155 [Vicinamibacteria bacterium]|nr:hypothetical protein [Vicinamibacteria bacterium]
MSPSSGRIVRSATLGELDRVGLRAYGFDALDLLVGLRRKTPDQEEREMRICHRSVSMRAKTAGPNRV